MRIPSCSRRLIFFSIIGPLVFPANPPIDPCEHTTRWQGTSGAWGLILSACPIARGLLHPIARA